MKNININISYNSINETNVNKQVKRVKITNEYIFILLHEKKKADLQNVYILHGWG